MRIRGILTAILLIILAVLLPSCMLDFEGTTTTDEQASIWTATEYEWPTSPDGIVDISYARKAGEVFPQREYHEIQGAGHMFRGKADEEACNLISRFMAQ